MNYVLIWLIILNGNIKLKQKKIYEYFFIGSE